MRQVSSTTVVVIVVVDVERTASESHVREWLDNIASAIAMPPAESITLPCIYSHADTY